jgi:hypothetical protein
LPFGSLPSIASTSLDRGQLANYAKYRNTGNRLRLLIGGITVASGADFGERCARAGAIDAGAHRCHVIGYQHLRQFGFVPLLSPRPQRGGQRLDGTPRSLRNY